METVTTPTPSTSAVSGLLHRALMEMGVENLVVDSASIEVKLRRKHAKTDRLDVAKLLEMLVRYHLGARRVWSVRVPSEEEEDRRHLLRGAGRQVQIPRFAWLCQNPGMPRQSHRATLAVARARPSYEPAGGHNHKGRPYVSTQPLARDDTGEKHERRKGRLPAVLCAFPFLPLRAFAVSPFRRLAY